MSDKNLELFFNQVIAKEKKGHPEGGIIFVTQNIFIKGIFDIKRSGNIFDTHKTGSLMYFSHEENFTDFWTILF